MPSGPPPASDTITSPRLSTAKPNGTAPLELATRAAPVRPSPATGTVLIVFELRSVTISRRPSAEKLTWAGPFPGSAWNDPAIGVSRPLPAPVNPATELPPPLRTNSLSPLTVRLTGVEPPEETVPIELS